MRKLKIIFIILVLAFSFKGYSQAEDNLIEVLSTSANASARLVRPLIIASKNDLAFGGIVLRNNSVGTVTLGTDGGRTFNNPANQSGFNETSYAPGVPTYTITGEIGLTYKITLPDDNDVEVTLETSDGGGAMESPKAYQKMSISAFLYKFSAGGTSTDTASQAVSETIPEGNVSTFTVGATLSIVAQQALGSYVGTYNVTVVYE
jgi:hypothetical protein